MIVPGRAQEWAEVWGAIEDDMQESAEKGLTIFFSVHEVETVCAVKMLQVRPHTQSDMHCRKQPTMHPASTTCTATAAPQSK